MTFGDKAEDRRAKVGTKVLAFGFAIFAVLGSFWTIVWFIRSYVEPPRVTISPALALASLDSKPARDPCASGRTGTDWQHFATKARSFASHGRGSTAFPAHEASRTRRAAKRCELDCRPLGADNHCSGARARSSGSVATRDNGAAPAPSAEPPADEIAESSVPAISGPAPLPRPKPLQTAAVRPAPPSRRCRARARTARRRRACGPPSQRPTTATSRVQ